MGRSGINVRTLGINGASDMLYLAVVENGVVLDCAPMTFPEPAGTSLGGRLQAISESATNVVQTLDVMSVAILDPEPNYNVKAVDFITRITLETGFAFGVTRVGIQVERLDRRSLRARLGLPKKGQLHTLVSQVTPKVGAHWAPRKRDLAALAALAALAVRREE